PSQYRLSNTLYGDAYQPARSGVAGAPVAPRAAPPPPPPPPPRAPAGAAAGKQRLTKVPRKSCPAAAFAAAICESSSFGVCASAAMHITRTAAREIMSA